MLEPQPSACPKHLHFQHTEDLEWNIPICTVYSIPMTSEHILVRKNKHSKFHSDTPSDNFATPGYHLEDTLACPPKSQDAIVAKDGLSWNSLLKICEQILVVTTITGMRDNPKDTKKWSTIVAGKKLFTNNNTWWKLNTSSGFVSPKVGVFFLNGANSPCKWPKINGVSGG